MTEGRNSADLVIVGGGVIGLASAREAASRGLRVLVLEKGRTARQASWAAAGMLSPLGEALEPGPFLRFGLESLSMWPEFAATLEDETGLKLEFRESEKIRIARSPSEEARLRTRLEWADRHGVSARWLDGEELATLEPELGGRPRGGLLLEDESRVDSRALGAALHASACRHGAEVREGTEVSRLIVEGDRVEGVELTGGQRVAAPGVLLAAGAWSGSLPGLPDPPPVRPMMGEMLAVRPHGVLTSRMLEGEAVYLVPRDDGRLLVGATEIDAGFQSGVSAGGMYTLLGSAIELVPVLEKASVAEFWSGLRPGTPDGLPILGPHPHLDGLLLATGHYRNGILFTPATASGIGDLLLESDASPFPPEFAPDRFSQPSGTSATP